MLLLCMHEPNTKLNANIVKRNGEHREMKIGKSRKKHIQRILSFRGLRSIRVFQAQTFNFFCHGILSDCCWQCVRERARVCVFVSV